MRPCQKQTIKGLFSTQNFCGISPPITRQRLVRRTTRIRHAANQQATPRNPFDLKMRFESFTPGALFSFLRRNRLGALIFGKLKLVKILVGASMSKQFIM